MTTMNPPRAHQRVSDWPDVIRMHVWLVQEEDNWQALAADFDIVGQGSTQGLTLENMQELVIDYLEACFEDGMTFEQIMRPIPRQERLRLEVGRLLNPLHRLLHRWVRRDGMIFPSPERAAHC
jgi:hypothetical protein